jgi:hypothetical protein
VGAIPRPQARKAGVMEFTLDMLRGTLGSFDKSVKLPR